MCMVGIKLLTTEVGGKCTNHFTTSGCAYNLNCYHITIMYWFNSLYYNLARVHS
ncbi:hypothetical protein ACOSP7_030315 [Xanthoceras sorbifolium]